MASEGSPRTVGTGKPVLWEEEQDQTEPEVICGMGGSGAPQPSGNQPQEVGVSEARYAAPHRE